MNTALPNHLRRVVTDGSDRGEWMRARSRGITATDVAKLSTPRSIDSAARNKLHGSSFSGNIFTRYGKQREPEIAAWVLREHGIEPSRALFHAETDMRHLATPDGLVLRERAPGVSVEAIRAATAAPLIVVGDVAEMTLA